VPAIPAMAIMPFNPRVRMAAVASTDVRFLKADMALSAAVMSASCQKATSRIHLSPAKSKSIDAAYSLMHVNVD
jgi:hypothetical protein